jgi:hypothetical protein
MKPWHYDKGKVRCIYPNNNLHPMAMIDIEAVRSFGIIVKNYIKITLIKKS